jgi:hypothetical protein
MRTDGDLEALVRAFTDCTLPHAAWTHREHLLVALWFLRRLPRPEATVRIRQGIQRYNAHNGNHTGYHETITLAWIAVISEFLARRSVDESLAEAAQALLAECGGKDFLLRYYSRDRLLSDAARHFWVAPDLQPLV